MTELFDLSAARAADRVRRREISPVELVHALLGRIDALDPAIQAWERVDREGALSAARLREREAAEGVAGPLHGVPVGLKDIIRAAGLPTTNGSPLFRDFVADRDATVVARLRRAGAIILGKTVATQFAYGEPPRTRNPWNLERTPGGSSSGSAASVAARMVPAALGTQTKGSNLKPAAYCGVVGLKPTYGRVSRHGVTPLSWSLDHVGIIVRTVEDAALFLPVLAGRDQLDPTTSDAPLADCPKAARERSEAPRLGLVVDYLERSQPEVAANLKEVAHRFERAGAEVREVRQPQSMRDILAIHAIMLYVEAAAVHSRLLAEHPEGYDGWVRTRVQVGQLVPAAAYVHAQRLRRRLRPRMEQMFEDLDCLLTPTVPAEAPDTSSIGDSSLTAAWTLFGFPSITLPSGLSRHRLPLGIQLVARAFREDTLLSVAAWCESVLDPLPEPC